MTVCEIFTVVLIMLGMILVGGFALIIAYGIQHCVKMDEEIEEKKRALDDRRAYMLARLESLRNQESSDDVSQESVIVPNERQASRRSRRKKHRDG